MIYSTSGRRVSLSLYNHTNLRGSHALQLRQAKLSFPSVHLLVGVNSDEDVIINKARCVMTHAERYGTSTHHKPMLTDGIDARLFDIAAGLTRLFLTPRGSSIRLSSKSGTLITLRMMISLTCRRAMMMCTRS
jgi:hypothetical protein